MILKRNIPISFETRIERLNSYCIGWLSYYRLARCKAHLKRLDEWIRRKLRCIRLKQCKRAKTIADFLISLGVKEFGAWMLALSGKGWWRKALARSSHQAMNLEWFEQQGLVSLSQRYEVFQLKRNRRGT